MYFKVIPPNRPVGYGSKWASTKQTRIVTIPVGYGDGYHRRMTGRAEVLIRENVTQWLARFVWINYG